MIYFSFTFPILLLVLLSYRCKPKIEGGGVGFVLWMVSYQFVFIGLLGIGLIQVHLGCESVLGECYVDGYPTWLGSFKFVASLCLLVWSYCAGVKAVANIFEGRAQMS